MSVLFFPFVENSGTPNNSGSIQVWKRKKRKGCSTPTLQLAGEKFSLFDVEWILGGVDVPILLPFLRRDHFEELCLHTFSHLLKTGEPQTTVALKGCSKPTLLLTGESFL